MRHGMSAVRWFPCWRANWIQLGIDEAGEGRLVKMLELTAVESAAGARLQERLARREAVVGLIGLGYAGLPLAVAFAETRIPGICVDLRPGRLESPNAGNS